MKFPVKQAYTQIHKTFGPPIYKDCLQNTYVASGKNHYLYILQEHSRNSLQPSACAATVLANNFLCYGQMRHAETTIKCSKSWRPRAT